MPYKCVGCGFAVAQSALGRQLNILVPRFPQQDNMDMVVVRTKFTYIGVVQYGGHWPQALLST